ncbi:MAG TPA: YwbE family protein [Polyangiaceae bacterium]|nr:YwbE family protein [Polyangiaceae bacterium]
MAEPRLKHNPFSALRQTAVATSAPAPSRPAAPAARAPLGRLIVREEFDATEAAPITRVLGVPREQLDALGKRGREVLGHVVLIEGTALVVLTNDGERVAGWLRDAGASEVVVVRRPVAADLSQTGEPGGTQRAQIRRGLRVAVVLKADQDSGTLTEGVVQDILTSSPVHPRGIKVRLESGQVGRVRRILAR